MPVVNSKTNLAKALGSGDTQAIVDLTSCIASQQAAAHSAEEAAQRNKNHQPSLQAGDGVAAVISSARGE